MVMLCVGGRKIAWADAEKLFAEAAEKLPVEFQDESGRVIATTIPQVGEDPDWVKAITPEEIARALAGPFLTLEEYRKQVDQK